MDISDLPRTRAVTTARMKKLGIETYDDLLHYYPTRHEELQVVSRIGFVQTGDVVTVQGTIEKFISNRTRRGMQIQKATIADETGSIDLVWYNQAYLLGIMPVGTRVSIAGQVEKFGNALHIKPSEYELIPEPSTPTLHTARLVPVYPQTWGLSSRTIREKVYYVLNELRESMHEFLPADILEKERLMGARSSIENIHFPENKNLLHQARARLGFDELFIKLLSSKLIRKLWEKETVSNPFLFNKTVEKKLQSFIESLPFTLTDGQKRTVDEILTDLKKKHPMNRFLQGDVGSGKTVVSAIAAYAAYLNGFQTLIMAPTEILAQQHFKTLNQLFTKQKLKIAIQTGANKTFTKKSAATREYDIIIGTHALITKFIDYDRVGLVVIDEQHRFGVRQRAQLKQKGFNPHLLTMTATPIPRTVSLTLYSELDLSIIDEMPKGRLPIKTHVVEHVKRKNGYEWIKKQIDTLGVQVYIICPLIEESEEETMTTVKAAKKEFENLRDRIFPKHKVALLHGKMKPKEKEEIMREFNDKKYDILVSTSVVEVGIDVPNATIMIIEGAERFGLAQLHQLRGRVGRGDKQSYCFLYTSTKEAMYTKRLHFFARTNSGMKLAEYDLKVRGPGDLYGTQQSGYSDLKIASITDYTLVKKVKDAVDTFLERYKLSSYPELKSRLDVYQIEQVSRD